MRLSPAMPTLLLTLTVSPASAVDPGAGITSRPSATPLELPDYLPPGQAGGLELPSAAEAAAPATIGGPVFLLRGVRFEGNTVFSDADLAPIAAPFIDTRIDVGGLEELRVRLTRHYVDSGYINSGVLLPNQQVTGGVITYRIVEGELTEIRVMGSGDLDPAYISERLRLAAGPPLNMEPLQERFQLLLTDPLIERMDARLGPGAHPGEGRMELAVTRAKPTRAVLGIDNHRPPSSGAEEARIDGAVNNLSGYGDLLNYSFTLSQGGLGFDLLESIPLSARDLRLDLRASASNTSVIEEPLVDVDIESEFFDLEIGLSQPLINSLQRRLTLGLRGALRWNNTSLGGVPFDFSTGSVDGETKVAVLRFYQEWIERGADQVLSARSTFSLGTDALGATNHGGRLPDGQFLAWLGQAQYARRLGDSGTRLSLRVLAQLADDRLLPLERLAIGGVYSVRGYRENELVRDNGYTISVQLNYPLQNHFPGLPGQLEAIPFWDYGSAWNKGESDDAPVLHSVGLGLRWQPEPRLEAEVFVAHRFEDIPARSDYDLQDDGIHFRFSAQID